MWYGVLALGVVTMVTHDVKVVVDKRFAAHDQTIDKISQSFSIDAGNLKATCGFFLNDPSRNRRLTFFFGDFAAIVNQAAILGQGAPRRIVSSYD